MYWIGIDTTHYSDVVKAFLERYPMAMVRWGKRKVSTDSDDWCTDKNLRSQRSFSLSVGRQVILFFNAGSDGLK